MAFDIKTARPVEKPSVKSGFDISTARELTPGTGTQESGQSNIDGSQESIIESVPRSLLPPRNFS